jgi:hypothetical protein
MIQINTIYIREIMLTHKWICSVVVGSQVFDSWEMLFFWKSEAVGQSAMVAVYKSRFFLPEV